MGRTNAKSKAKTRTNLGAALNRQQRVGGVRVNNKGALLVEEVSTVPNPGQMNDGPSIDAFLAESQLDQREFATDRAIARGDVMAKKGAARPIAPGALPIALRQHAGRSEAEAALKDSLRCPRRPQHTKGDMPEEVAVGSPSPAHKCSGR